MRFLPRFNSVGLLYASSVPLAGVPTHESATCVRREGGERSENDTEPIEVDRNSGNAPREWKGSKRKGLQRG